MENIKILVVEDENIVALDIENRLKGLGFIVLPVISSGEEAVEKAYEYKPDLVLMDILLKGKINGIDAAKKIVGTLKIPIIYLTASTNRELLERARQIGHCSYITKPFMGKDLENAIKTLLKTN
ncbi:response regulator [Methanobacterium sp.]|jgi:CheY-like chemotaxis protein|uniref:response regulator n=1 Tax=Methanobacterium sp. TaxID=2164 RepID=UPI003159770A